MLYNILCIKKLRSKDLDEVLIDDDSTHSDTNSNSNETIESKFKL